jgi:hypothetical protein
MPSNYSPKDSSPEKAKELFLQLVQKGLTIDAICSAVGRTRTTYERWRASDKEFAQAVDRIRSARESAVENGVSQEGVDKDIDFATWRKRYLGYDTYPHQAQWIDVLEGRDPKPLNGLDFDDNFHPGNRSRIIINTPPGHTKSQTITIDYVTYRICMDPNVRIIIVSKRREQAQKFLYAIKQRLTSKRFALLQETYAPKGGWAPQKGEGSFAANIIYVSGRTADHKDPTVEVLGLGSQIYGSRADLIILDDVVTLSNVNQYEDQITWLTSEVESRTKGGKILVVGTRLKSIDFYGELMNGDRYTKGVSPWTYLRQPMVLRFADDINDWITLWPKSSTAYDTSDETPDADGQYVMFDGEKADEIRSRSSALVWSMVYQQSPMNDDAVFKPTAVYGSMNRMRKPGPLTAGRLGHPMTGGDGMYTIASMDPAMTGDTFTLVGKVDRVTKLRWIEQAWVKTQPTPQYIRDLIKSVTVEYNVNEWVIEKNAFQVFLTKDEEILAFLHNRGVKLTPHFTGSNKADPDFGVASLETLFGTTHRLDEGAGREVHDHNNLIQLPDAEYSPGIKALVEQLFTWEPGIPGSKLKMDGPMALWFFELRARLIVGNRFVGSGERTDFVKTRFTTLGAKNRQGTKPRSVFANYRVRIAREVTEDG